VNAALQVVQLRDRYQTLKEREQHVKRWSMRIGIREWTLMTCLLRMKLDMDLF